MSMQYIRKTYNVPAKRGGRVRYTTATQAVQGTIVGTRGQYLRIKWAGSGVTRTHHPTDNLVYEDNKT